MCRFSCLSIVGGLLWLLLRVLDWLGFMYCFIFAYVFAFVGLIIMFALWCLDLAVVWWVSCCVWCVFDLLCCLLCLSFVLMLYLALFVTGCLILMLLLWWWFAVLRVYVLFVLRKDLVLVLFGFRCFFAIVILFVLFGLLLVLLVDARLFVILFKLVCSLFIWLLIMPVLFCVVCLLFWLWLRTWLVGCMFVYLWDYVWVVCGVGMIVLFVWLLDVMDSCC